MRRWVISLAALVLVSTLAPALTMNVINAKRPTISSTISLILASGETLRDSGMLNHLIESFNSWAEERYGLYVDVQYISVGTGRALRLAERGDVDALLLHSPSMELIYAERGVITCRYPLAYNYFVLVGPKGLIEGLKGLSASEALGRIREMAMRGEALFVSRGDESGTHQREKELWEYAGLRYEVDVRSAVGSWYVEAGKGMAMTLMIANELGAFTLSDPATWSKLRNRLKALGEVAVKRDATLLNVYSIAITNPERHVINKYAARMFYEFLTGEAGEEAIEGFSAGLARPLFTPISRINNEPLEDEVDHMLWRYSCDI